MLRLLLLALLFAFPLLAQAAPRDWANATCEDDLDSCRESCTIADGTSLSTQGKLQRCVDRCREESERCIFQRFRARRALDVPATASVPNPARAATPSPRTRSTSEAHAPLAAPRPSVLPLEPMAPRLEPVGSRSHRTDDRSPASKGSPAPAQSVHTDGASAPSSSAPPPTQASPAPASRDEGVDVLLDPGLAPERARAPASPAPRRSPGRSKPAPPKNDAAAGRE